MLCRAMQVSRSGFYKWQKRVNNPSQKVLQRYKDVALFIAYHNEYTTHGYRWLRAKIELDTGIVFTDKYAHKCCKYAGIRSKSKRYRYKKPGEPMRTYPNIILSNLNIAKPLEVVVSDNTMMYVNGKLYEITLYLDLFNNEIIGYAVSTTRGDPRTYHEGLINVLNKKKEQPNLEMILHTDQGSVYSSKSFNELLPYYNIKRSMSRAGTPTDNATMESVIGWVKEELFMDFNIKKAENIEKAIENYIYYFNNERPAYALNYLTPAQFKQNYLLNQK